MKKSKTAYWIATVLFAVLMLLDGFGGITQQQAGRDVMIHLGYPMYFLIITGIAKWLGVIAILQTKYVAIKEWAYAGFAFNFICGAVSRSFVGDSIGMILMPLVALIIMFIPYFLWKRTLS